MLFAHAILEKASPAPNSQVKEPPKEIVLTFNERMEGEFYSIKVFNADGDIVTESETQLSIDQKQLSQVLPSLSMGLIWFPIVFYLLMDIQLKGLTSLLMGKKRVNSRIQVHLKNQLYIDSER